MMRALLVLALAVAGCGRAAGDWQARDAFRRCGAVIDAWRPGEPTPPCPAMHMCANEAPLTAAQARRLSEMISAASPACEPP